MTTEKVKYGVHSEAGKLRKVMVCSPGLAHQRLTPNNCDELLFDDVLWVAQAKRDHFDFVTKMRERDIDVLEMHNLLTDIVAIPEALDWILDHKVTPNQVGVGLVNEVKSWLKSLEPRQIAEYLIGGVVIRINDIQIDGCVASRIRAMQDRFGERALHEIHAGKGFE